MLAGLALAVQVVVVSVPPDAYRPAAEEIAREERAALADSWPDRHAGYVLWVVEPSRLSDRAIVEFVRAWRDRFPEAAVGIITGSTPDLARALWRRRDKARSEPSAAFDARLPISKARFLEALRTHGHVSFAGHGGETYLRLGAEGTVRAPELPVMDNLVVSTESCNVFRLWRPGSIALAFADRGAAAFAGFAYSPEAGFLIGGYGLPFLHTHPEFPVGRVVQLQNRGAMRAFAALPIYLLLGDPRTALRSETPYRLAADEVYGESRRIRLEGAANGFVPVRIPGGSGYELVEAAGTSAASGHGFFNSRLQAIDAGKDKFVLAAHAGGPLEIRLRRAAPFWWPARTLLIESLDNGLVFLAGNTGGAILLLVISMFVLVVVGFRQPSRAAVIAGILAGLLLAALHAGWAFARAGEVTTIAKKVEFNPLGILNTFLLAGGSAVLYSAARGPVGRVLALILATVPGWLPAALHLSFTIGTNVTVFRRFVGASIYSHRMGLLSGWAWVVMTAVVAAVFPICRRLASGAYRGGSGSATAPPSPA